MLPQGIWKHLLPAGSSQYLGVELNQGCVLHHLLYPTLTVALILHMQPFTLKIPIINSPAAHVRQVQHTHVFWQKWKSCLFRVTMELLTG